MNKILRALYLNALKQTGKHTEAFLMIEEQLHAKDLYDLKAFIGWLGDNKAPLGVTTIQAKWDEFANHIATYRKGVNITKQYHNKFDKMSRAITQKMLERHDTFETELLLPGASIELHKVCYPLKNATVVSYNPETKEVVLKLK